MACFFIATVGRSYMYHNGVQPHFYGPYSVAIWATCIGFLVMPGHLQMLAGSLVNYGLFHAFVICGHAAGFGKAICITWAILSLIYFVEKFRSGE